MTGPDGKPANGVTAHQLSACYDSPQKLADGTFTAVALDPEYPRTVLFVDAAKKLSATLVLTGNGKEPVAKLQPWGTASGRLLDADGKPVAGAVAHVYVKNQMRHMAFSAIARGVMVTTDAAGKFALELPSGPAEYVVFFKQKNKTLSTGARYDSPGTVVKPGATTDLGDVKVQQPD